MGAVYTKELTFPYTPGIEVAGVVEEVGPGVTAFEIGQAVFGQIASGANAEYITVAVEVFALKPETLSSSLAVLKPGGTLISIADLPPQEQARVRGVRAMMSRGAASTPLQTFTRLIDEGHLKVTAGKTFPLNEVQQAHDYSRSGHGCGRIVLQVVGEAQNTFV
jgi:NADPH:quinone reductase-like Zn-dependent oxidoreductase